MRDLNNYALGQIINCPPRCAFHEPQITAQWQYFFHACLLFVKWGRCKHLPRHGKIQPWSLFRRARTRLAALALDHGLLAISLDRNHTILGARAGFRFSDGTPLLHKDTPFYGIYLYRLKKISVNFYCKGSNKELLSTYHT